ncbi:estradiol 17-beta-dehydrogenase 11-like [Sphaerodactylus townsendi]|uniref:estradiol 17-beta-dehydrogenase 11-like n=1 Tax=Sphaerodactylus townsendi TaxID=933632 RepID=UPI00202618CD|nr:estradiol 17-beta-dehydrogenase 11-like [Sphaerodactylus townsendi]
MYLLLEIPLFILIILYSYLEAFVKLFIPAKRKLVTGEIVLITGAGHGLGRATAYEFAKHRSIVVLWDINKAGIEETAAECGRLGATAYPFVVDCSKKEEIYCAAEKVKRQIGDVSILMNNAGVITTTDLLSTEDHDIEKIFEVNILAHYWTSKAFLPAMMENSHGHIITVASAVGHIVAPFIVPYCSSKFAAVGLHRALTMELSALKKNGVQTSCVCPMFINSDFVKNPSSRLMPPLEPEQVAKQVMEGILTNQSMIFIPPFLKFSVMLDRFLPARAIPALWKLNDIKFDVVVAYKDKEK